MAHFFYLRISRKPMTVSSKMWTTSIKTFVLVALFAFGSSLAQAQDYKETYNEAREAAVAKDYPTALSKYASAADGAAAEGDDEVERKSRQVVAQLEYIIGRGVLQQEDYAGALAHFDNGIANYPSYAKNYLARASALKKMGQQDDAIAAFAQTMEIATAGSDTKTARQAEEAIRGHFVFLASTALSRNGARTSTADADEAMSHIEAMLQFVEPDADVYYYTAESQKVRGLFADAIASADQALSVHRGSRTDKAKIYFVKGEAMMNSGDVAGAKSAFQNAAYGNYRASAEHYIETLGSN